MKLRLFLLLILLPTLGFAQKFELKQPDIKKIKAAVDASGHHED